MPAETILVAAATFDRNSKMFAKAHGGLTDEEWLRRPGENSNHLLWIIGHMIWARGAVLRMLGSECTRPWFPLFSIGSKVTEAAEYPSVEELKSAWQEMAAALATALEQAAPDALSAKAPERIPTFDGKLSGTIEFMAYHETYHVGQVAYLKTWLGHEGISG